MRAAVTVVENDLGADQVGAALRAAGVRPVAGDALGGIDLAAAQGGGFVDHLLIGRARGKGRGRVPALRLLVRRWVRRAIPDRIDAAR